MASETTDRYKVCVKFADERLKFIHEFRRSYDIKQHPNKFSINLMDSGSLHDQYVVRRSYLNTKEKWEDYFRGGEWTKEYSVNLLKSTSDSDEFEVKAIYKGGMKPFEKIFYTQFSSNNATFVAELLETETKNLGVKRKRSETDDIKIIQQFIDEALENAGLVKSKTIPKKPGYYKTTLVAPTKYFFHDDKSSVVCVHLSSWKIGIIPDKNDFSKVQIYVHYPHPPSYNGQATPDWDPILGVRGEAAFQSLEIVKKRDRKTMFDNMKEQYSGGRYRDRAQKWDFQRLCPAILHFIGDPNFQQKLSALFLEIDRRSPSRAMSMP